MGRTAPQSSKSCILYIYSTNIGTEYFKHALYSPIFFSSKCSLFHNANLFGICIIHILYTGCAEIKKKYISGAKGLIWAWKSPCANYLLVVALKSPSTLCIVIPSSLIVACRDSQCNSLGRVFLCSTCLTSKVCLCRATGNYYRSLGRLALDVSGHRQRFTLLL